MRDLHETEVEELEGQSTVYKITDSPRPSFDMTNAVKSYHAEENDVDYSDLSGTKVAENHTKGHFIVVVVELTE